MASFSWEMVVSVWVTPLSSCKMVISPLTSLARSEMVVDSGRRVPDIVSASKSNRSCGVRRRVILAWASCYAMKARGCSIEGVPDRDKRGKLRADILPKAGFPGGIWWGCAMRARKLGEVGEGFDPDRKRGKVEFVCEM